MGVPVTTTQEAIRNRFRFLSQAFHPDKFTTPEHRRLAEEEFKLINEAHRVLAGIERDQDDAEQMPQPPAAAARDHYSVLRISHRAASSAIQRRYQFLRVAYDPTRFASIDHKLRPVEELGLVEQAAQILSDPEQRAVFDNSRRRNFRPLLKPEYVPSESQPPEDSFPLDEAFNNACLIPVFFTIAGLILLMVMSLLGPPLTTGLVVFGVLAFLLVRRLLK